MGIIQLKNLVNNKVYLASSLNIPGTINSLKFQLSTGNFPPSQSLAKDWLAMGAESFSIEIIDELTPVDNPHYDYKDDLNTLLHIRLENYTSSDLY